MAADELIFKKKGQKISVKITKGMANGHTPHSYHIKVNLGNYKDLALFLQDLKYLHGAPMGKAIDEFKKNEQDSLWPF